MADRDRHVRRGQDEYATALAALLPEGIAWPRQLSSVLMKVVRGLAGILGFVDSRAADLLEIESDPRTTVEILPEWERAFGLPDLCLTVPTDIAVRQKLLVKRITLLGSQSRQFFIDLAASIGYVITIREFSPFMCGVSRCGNTKNLYDNIHYRWQIGPPIIRFFWIVKVAPTFLLWFHVSNGGWSIPELQWHGGGQCGIDPLLRIGRRPDLECLLHRYGPAHTQLIFDYSIAPRIRAANLAITMYSPGVTQMNIGGRDLREDASLELREDNSISLRE